MYGNFLRDFHYNNALGWVGHYNDPRRNGQVSKFWGEVAAAEPGVWNAGVDVVREILEDG